MKLKIKQLLFQAAALIIKGFIIFAKNVLTAPVRKAGRFLFSTTLPLYNLYLTLKRIFIKFYSPFQIKHKLIHPFARRYFIHFLVVIMSCLVTVSNLNALEVQKDASGYSNILSSLVVSEYDGEEGEEYEILYEEGPITSFEENRYLGNGVVGGDVHIDFDDFHQDFDDNTITSGGALVKPVLPTSSNLASRTEAVEYVVEEGDTVTSIAAKFGISINTILWENNLTAYTIIRPGQKIIILPISGVRHKVVSGDSVGKIAKKYTASEEDIIEFNRLASANDLKVGERLIIPGGKKPQVTQTFTLRKLTPSKTADTAASSLTFPGIEKFIWPATCRRITQYFTWRHSGVDIACKKGSSILASADGVVIRAEGGWNGGYGIIVVLDHGNNMQTVYAHLNQMYVNIGDTVKAGQAVGAEGTTGRSTGPHVHFEIRDNGRRINPLSIVK